MIPRNGSFEVGVMNERLEERVAKVEGILDQMDKRLGRVESEIKELREEMRVEIRELRSEMIAGFQRMEERFRAMEERFQRMDDRFYSFMKWIIAALIGMWGTLMAAILALLFKG